MPRHDTACPYCSNTERVRIRRIDGSLGLYCPSCRYIETIASPFSPRQEPGRPVT